jgi:hypothetical protein
MTSDEPNNIPQEQDPLIVGELRPLKDLALEFALSYNSLRGYAIRGRLRAVKFGNQWASTRQAIEEYLISRHLENIPKKYRDRS